MFRSIRKKLSNAKIRSTRPLYGQVLVVVMAFALMVVLSYRFMSDIEREHLIRDIDNAISNTEAQITADLLEPETFLASISETIRIMILQGESPEIVYDYIAEITRYITSEDHILSYSTVAYGFFDVFDHHLFVGNGWQPPEDFVIEKRPWYIAAVEADGKVAITEPYVNRILDLTVLTFSRRIFDTEGKPLGIICLDVTLDRIRDYAVNTYITKGSYGILGDKELNVIAHPHPDFFGKSIRDMNDGEAIVEIMRQGHKISERKATDYNGNQSVLFIRQLNNGWTMAVIAYAKDYYQSVAGIAKILIALGMVLAAIVSAILIRIISEKYKTDERMQVMIDAMPLGANFWNKNHEIIDCNDEAIRFFGLTDKQDYLDRFYELSPSYQPCGDPSKLIIYENLKKTFEDGYHRFEWMHQKPDGEPLPCEVTLVRVKYRNEFIVLSYNRDLREEKALINEINSKNDELKKLVHWYEAILDTIPFLISVTDEDMNWRFINKAVEKFLGIRRKDSIGQPCSNWKANICNTENCGITCMKRGLKRTFFTHNDMSLQIDAEILTDLNGETEGFIEIVQDITKLEEMAKSQAEAVAASHAKSAFLARVSHEIRTPMNAILSIAEIQLQNEALPPKIEEAFSKIYNSGYLLLGIINDILNLSKIEAGKLELTPVKYDVASLINDTIHLNAMRYDSKPIDFGVQVEETVPATLYGDDLRIKQILNNLLSNAFKYTGRGDITLVVTHEDAQIQSIPPGAVDLTGAVSPEETIAASSSSANQIMMVFRISDTGQGMSREQMSVLFDEYTRFNNEANRSTEGTGLGMTITRSLIRMMNGRIFVESEPDKGSVFTVILPQEKVDDGILGSEAVENLRQFRLGKISRMKRTPQITRDYMPYGKVLVVDDVDTNLYVAKGLLAPYGLSIDAVASGFEAIEKIKNGAVYDIVFMDHFMPKMDGIEATQKIRNLGYTQPIIALTANALSGQAEMFQENGFDDFISKPIDVRQLDNALNRLIRDKYPPEKVESAKRLKEGLEKLYKAEDVSQPLVTKLADIFARDAGKAAARIERIYKKQNIINDNDIKDFVNAVQTMKNALEIIGENKLSRYAVKLEQAARVHDTTVIANETPLFLSALRTLVDEIKPIDVPIGAKTDEISNSERVYLEEKLLAVQGACAARDKNAVKEILVELKKASWPRLIKERLNIITEHLLRNDFDGAAAAAREQIT